MSRISKKWKDFFEQGAKEYITDIGGDNRSEAVLVSIQGFSWDAFEQGSEITLRRYRKLVAKSLQEEIDKLTGVESKAAPETIQVLNNLKKKLSRLEP